jgi:alkylhydroperoxidase family enzyme
MTHPRRDVSEAFFRRLRRHFSEAEVVSLTSAIAMQNYHSKFNRALRVEVNSLCPIPLERLGARPD